MPGGSDPLVSRQWQPVPGCSEAQVYPFIRKVDTTSSNSYLLQLPDALVLIDPGGLPDQAAHLAGVVRQVQAEKPLPLLMVLTHAHTDHFLAIPSVREWTDPAVAAVAIHDCGAAALASADRRVTQAEILDQQLPPIRIDLRLFGQEREEGGDSSARCTLANGAVVTVLREPPVHSLAHEQILIGGDSPPLSIYHTPGHSPDSCCLQLGSLLFIGDLLFAAAPGMSGICGWNQGDLTRSLAGIQALISLGGITGVCPGHGWVLTAAEAARQLSAVQRDTSILGGITEMNWERSQVAAAFAEDCMEQVHDLFTVMTGRLYYVTYVLDELGETETATNLPSLISSEVIDDLLDGFSAFSEEFHAGRRVPLHLALKGGQVIAKLQRTFNQGLLAEIIDPTLVERGERLLADYTMMLRGFNPPRDLREHDLHRLIERCLADRTIRPHSDEDLVASADDDAAFARMLLNRIGTPPLLEGITVTVERGTGPLNVSLDRGRFTDLVTYLLEDLVGSGATVITVHVRRQDGTAVVTFSGSGGAGAAADGSTPRRFFSWLCDQAAGSLSLETAAGMPQYTIRFPPGA